MTDDRDRGPVNRSLSRAISRIRRAAAVQRSVRALVVGGSAILVALALGTSPDSRLVAGTLDLSPSSALASTGDPVVAAAGDIACDPLNTNFNGGAGSTNSCHQKAVSDLLVNAGLTAVLDLGDNQYYCGGYNAFLQSYDKSWGRVKNITRPAVGNHEYITSPGSDRTGCDSTNEGAAGYFRYFGAAAGEPGKGYYSYDIGSWHAIVLNSACGSAGGCGPTTPQGQWLRADLAAHNNYCTLAYWHVPLFSSGGRASSTYKTFWDALYAADADVVLNGHDHIYERFAPQTPSGAKDVARGLREFVVGTGGANHTSLGNAKPNSERRNSDSFGVLELTLHPTSYDWRFVPEAGKSFTDSGTTACHGVRTDTVAPSAPTGVSATAISPGLVSVTWQEATDDVGVSGYRVLRNGTQVGEVTTTQLTDDTVVPGTSYSYTVVAYDSAGNTSAASAPADVTTPADVTAPSVPTGLTATPASPDRVDLSWLASTDDVRVAGYDVLRDGAVIGSSSTTSYPDTTALPSTTYSYQVRARDESGNVSAPSSPVSATTPARPSVLDFRAVDDTYVRSDLPSSTFGSATTVQVDGSPTKNGLLRFQVSGIAGREVVSAVLELYCVDSGGSGGSIFRTDGAPWSEASVTWSTRPATSGAAVATVGKVTSGQWYQVDLTSLVRGDGTYDLEMTSASSDGADYTSDEDVSGRGPRLEVTVR
jgi:chitodextrinase